ncbi:hypothetical protein BDR26DRAFT_387226 [Obelidium mucronatum]|nr:hypothetical protein BDR26DRAFT_387226 [Obelidium mucronatum]
MISKNNPTPSDLTPHESAVMLQHATHIRLDRSNIETLNGITHFQAITHLHIQYNFISSLKPLANLPHLRILCAEGNLISRIEGLNELQELKLLDVSKNLIQEIEIEQLPQSLENFLIKENPCTIAPDYRLQLIYGLKELSVLDEVDIGPEEKRLSKMRFGDEQERLDAITWNPETENEEENETEETNSEKEKKEEIMSGDAEVFSPVNDEAGGEDRVVSITIDLEPFKSTVDAILERSRIRQAESVIDNRIRMDELIAQMRASGKARTERLKKVIASLN